MAVGGCFFLVRAASDSGKNGDGGVEPQGMEVNWGPKVGLDFMVADRWYSTRGHDPDEAFLGAAAGATVRFTWKQHWYIQPALMLEYDNASTRCRKPMQAENVLIAETVMYDISRFGVQIPVHAGYRFSITGDYGMSVFTGAFIQCGLSGTFEPHDHNQMPDFPHFSLYGGDSVWERWNYGGIFGVTFEIGPRFVVSVDANFGFKKMNRKDIFTRQTLNESIGRIGLTYWVK